MSTGEDDELTGDRILHPHLHRKFGLLQAVALNMSNMVGAGPFITIPILLTHMGGPQAMLGWLLAALTCIPDGMIWSQLGAAMPGSGGSYIYLRESYGHKTFGRLMAFLFIWQFILSGPLEIATGYIGFADYLHYVWPSMTDLQLKLLAAGVGVLTVAVLYRKITFVSKLTVALWAGLILCTLTVILTGAFKFDPKVAFDFPPGAFKFSLGFFVGLGAATRVGIYDYLGYYDICFIGDEVKNPRKVIPQSVIFSLIAVALLYFAINLSVIGVIPWKEFVPADDHPASKFIVSLFMERIYGATVAKMFTVMILWTAFASVFALLLGYSRIPYAAALDGYFFRIFGKLHPKGGFPYVSLLVIGAIASAAAFLPLDKVIDSLLGPRILIQFIGQIAAVTLLRRRALATGEKPQTWLYPLPSLIAFAGWTFVFLTADTIIKVASVGILAAGLVAFLVWSWLGRKWPFAQAEA